MVVTSMKTTFAKVAPKKMVYRDMKKFDKSAFKCDLRNRLKEPNLSKFEHFEEIFDNVLDKHAPKKTKIIRANNKPCVTNFFENFFHCLSIALHCFQTKEQ